ncbi:MAG: DUF445 domain-containing protein [Gammaproteobacteria bacterium]|nr:DUF445 domain-containing protein [Gammaproteobacteria bacterium]MBI5616388.1 DUF445 domain-containing protein [Gammaproteobacteria bacterium]
MSPTDTDSALHERRQALSRAKWAASGLLLAVTVLYAAARALEGRYPGLAAVAAFAEAAMVGALADWFAVTALFRHPLGLPFPHTAIIPRSRAALGRRLSSFIVSHFLTTTAVLDRVREFNPAQRLSAALVAPRYAAALSGYALRAARFMLDAVDDERVRHYLQATVTNRLLEVDVAELSGKLLGALTDRGRHQALLDAVLKQLGAMLDREEIRARIIDAIAKELDALRYKWLARVGIQLDEILGRFSADKVVAAVHRLLEEINADPDHSVRREFDVQVATFVARLESDPAYRLRLERLRDEVLARPELAAYLHQLWTDFKGWIVRDLGAADSALGARLSSMWVRLGTRLAADTDMQAWINERVDAAATRFVEDYRGKLVEFIERQIAAWDDRYMVEQVELNIGRDLQYIRFSGTLVGGSVGLLIYGITELVRG